MRPQKLHLMLLIIAVLMPAAIPVGAAPPPVGHGYDFPGNGKRPGRHQADVWTEDHSPFALGPQAPAPGRLGAPLAVAAAERNLTVVKRYPARDSLTMGNLRPTGDQVRRTADLVRAWLAGGGPAPLDLRYYRWHGEDAHGNVHFTGYFSPLLPARASPDARFRFPIYRMPADLPTPRPTRRDIEERGLLAGRGLELAWTDDPLSLFFLHVQGSGWLEFPDGRRQAVEYAGQNGHRYASLGRMLVDQGAISPERISLRAIRDWFAGHPGQLRDMLWRNPSYTFFRPRNRPTSGAAGVELTAGHAVAADRRFLPLGSCLLAEVPVLDAAGVLTGYEWRVLFVHDTGGAIRDGHLDVFHGMGSEAGDRAGDLHHYGRVWVLLAGDVAGIDP